MSVKLQCMPDRNDKSLVSDLLAANGTQRLSETYN